MDFWSTLLAENAFPVVVSVALAYWVVYISKQNKKEIFDSEANHRKEIMTLIETFRSDQKEERRSFEAKLDKMMQDHILERTESRQQWQFSIKELSEKIAQLTEKIRTIN